MLSSAPIHTHIYIRLLKPFYIDLYNTADLLSLFVLRNLGSAPLDKEILYQQRALVHTLHTFSQSFFQVNVLKWKKGKSLYKHSNQACCLTKQRKNEGRLRRCADTGKIRHSFFFLITQAYLNLHHSVCLIGRMKHIKHYYKGKRSPSPYGNLGKEKMYLLFIRGVFC